MNAKAALGICGTLALVFLGMPRCKEDKPAPSVGPPASPPRGPAQLVPSSLPSTQAAKGDTLVLRKTPTTAGVPDCNHNQTDDARDITGGTSLDCNENHTPDECELAVAAAPDCDHNGTIDSCEWFDCDSNGTHDPCDLLHGAPDCNADQILDRCELANNDCNKNGTPDDCEYSPDRDCNENRALDPCDITARTSRDCQPDGTPDECQLYGRKTAALEEGFETAVPPPGWTAVVNNQVTWLADASMPSAGAHSATCLSDEGYPGTQDEWLVTPPLQLTGVVTLTGATLGSASWGVTPYDNYDVEVWLVLGPKANDSDDELLGQLDQEYWGADYKWQPFEYQFLAPSEPFRIGFRYHGYDGAQTSLDALVVRGTSGPPPNDCNRNGVPDDCDLQSRTSRDANGNRVPDECEDQ